MISVVIPTYNRPHLLEESVNSVLKQTFQDIEIIIVDGSASTETKRKVESISDLRIKYFKIDNVSAAHSRNYGIKQATGDYIAFNDDDDIWLPDKLDRQLNALQRHPNDTVLYTCFEKKGVRYERIIPDETVSKTEGYIYEEMLLRNFIGLPTILLPSKICETISFDENLTCLEDWEWTIRLAKNYHFDLVKKPLVVARDTPSSVNKSEYATKAAAYEYIYNKHSNEISRTPRIKAKHLLSIGNNLCLSGNMVEGRKFLFQSFKASPVNILSLFSYLTSLLGENTYRQVFKLYESKTGRQQ